MTRTLTVTPGTPSGLSWDGAPLEVWGLRVASGAAKDAWTDDLVGHLDEYLSYGLNALTVFYQGCSGGSLQAFSPDGREIDPAVQRRMERILDAAAERQMLVVAGIFYQNQAARLDPENGAWLEGRDAYPRAVEAVARSLRRYPNVIVNTCNEHTVRSFETCPFPMRTAEGMVELCLAAKQGDPDRLVGGGGGHGAGQGGGQTGVNEQLVARPEVDVLLWDWGNHSPEAVAAYQAIDPRKPTMNVEVFGARAQGFVEVDADGPKAGQSPVPAGAPPRGGDAAASASPVSRSAPSTRPYGTVAWVGGSSTTPPPPAGRKRIQGVFPEGESEGEGRAIHRGKADFLAEIDCAASTPGFSLFGHFPGWYQGPSRDPSFDNRFDLGGQGTLEDPGIRWYFEAVARTRGVRASGRTPRSEQ
jgi:hypothetical protein